MNEGVVESAAQQAPEAPEEKTINGVTVAVVLNNVDSMSLGRVQLKLPWMPGFEPWARVATPMAGMGRGAFFIPQIGDEVVVAFNHGDLRDPYVVGSVWNSLDKPPATLPTDSVTKRAIRTPLGHELEFDEALQTVTLKSATQQTVEMSPDSISISATGGVASITLGTDGSITIRGKSIDLQAVDSIKLTAGTGVEASAAGSVALKAGSTCDVKAPLVAIN
jgi:uncharacterized protein involved in type VI secretion and phage assembly